MIIYGSRAVHLNSVQLPSSSCPACAAEGSLVLSVYRKHAHIFWIPLFPIGKVGLSQCLNCKNARESNEMPDGVRKEFENLKRDTKGPIWQFAGLGLIALLVFWISIASAQDKKHELELMASPQTGDIYQYKDASNGYSTFKIVSVSPDSLFISANEFSVSKSSRINEIDKSENYDSLPFRIARSRIKEMYDSGEIVDIKR